MVNKGSFFQRLKGRWGSASGVRFEEAAASSNGSRPIPSGKAQPAEPGAQPAEPEVVRPSTKSRGVSSTFQPAGTRSTRKMSEREEAMQAVGDHFQELTSLMRGSQAASDEKLQKIVEATSSIPALGQQQIETLQVLSKQMDKQNQLGEKMSTAMTRLPNLLENVEKALERAAKTDERTAATVTEFHKTMDRIHASMGKMVEHSGDQAKAAQQLAESNTKEFKNLAGDIAQTQKGATKELQRTADEGLQQLTRTHERQSSRLQKIVEEQAGWNRAVLVGVGLIVLGLGAVIILQLMN